MMLIDPAVGSKDLVEPLKAMGLPAVAVPTSGDIAFEGRGIGGKPVTIGIEYKKLGEFIGSLMTERLQGHQLVKMQSGFDFRWVLIEGEVLTTPTGYLARRAGKHKRVPYPGHMTVTGLWKRLLTLQVCGGLTPIMVETRDQSLHVIEALYRFWTDKNQDEHKSHIAIYEPAHLLPISQFRRTVATLPGIGVGLSLRVADRFVSLREAFNAPVAAWTQVDGIGTKTAERIVKAIS
jgi:ERCC4-type nuclease